MASPPLMNSEIYAFLQHLAKTRHKHSPLCVQLYKYYSKENELRHRFARKAGPHELYWFLVPVFHPTVQLEGAHKTKVRNLDDNKYVCVLSPEMRRKEGEDSFVQGGLAGFKRNWDIFTEGALETLNWNNVFAAGGAVMACLQPLPQKVMTSGTNGPTPRSIREYFHQEAYPSSDIDLFLYGLKTEEGAKKKMLQIYQDIKNCARADVTCIRTAHAVTIVCKYPQRHIQIILRMYQTPSEILFGFDVDACAVGFNGAHVFAAPRAFIAFVTQTIEADVTRRSPSYEMRLAKYASRGFEIFCKDMFLEMIDPTIYDRSPLRLRGLARLLVLTTFRSKACRDRYLDHRREARGLPKFENFETAMTYHPRLHNRAKNTNDLSITDLSELMESFYDTFHIPYGRGYSKRSIEHLAYQTDLMLNEEWNPKNCPPQRPYKLHRHPCFFGDMHDILGDCCGRCPKPECEEAIAMQKQEDEKFVRGPIRFIVDDPGRQSIGSFHPISSSGWYEMAHLTLPDIVTKCVAKCLQRPLEELGPLDYDVNKRDHVGRTLVYVAVEADCMELVKYLYLSGARLTARNPDGRTALHFACEMGYEDIVDSLLKWSKRKSERKKEKEKAAEAAEKVDGASDVKEDRSEQLNNPAFDKPPDLFDDPNSEDDIFDLNLPDWDYGFTPLHYAIFNGHHEVVKRLIDEGADKSLPVFIPHARSQYTGEPQTILPIVLATHTPNSVLVARHLLYPGVSSQLDSTSTTAFHMVVQTGDSKLVELLLDKDPKAKDVISHLNHSVPPLSPLHSAIRQRDKAMVELLLENGAEPEISMDRYLKYRESFPPPGLPHSFEEPERWKYLNFRLNSVQPLEFAMVWKCAFDPDPGIVELLLDHGASIDTVPVSTYRTSFNRYSFIDLFNDRIAMIEMWKEKPLEDAPESAVAPKADGASYVAWAQINYQLMRHESSPKTDSTASLAKGDEIEAQHAAYKELQKIFTKRGAKPWDELFEEDVKFSDAARDVSEVVPGGDASIRLRLYMKYGLPPPPLKEFTPSFLPSELVPGNTRGIVDSSSFLYLQLFEKVWQVPCDFAAIKTMTLTLWGPTGENLPLKVAVCDNFMRMSLVMIALYHDNFDLARMLLDIARMQYRPPREGVNYAYPTDGSNSDSETESYIADDTFNICDVAHRISPSELLRTPANLLYLCHPDIRNTLSAKLPEVVPNMGEPVFTAATYALAQDNFKAFVEILNIAEELEKGGATRLLFPRAGYKADNSFYGVPLNIKMAMILGRVQFLEEIIRRTGWGIDFEMLESEAQAQEAASTKSDPLGSYAGLKVRGKFRRDWAEARSPVKPPTYHVSKLPIAFIAAYFGSPETIDWAFSDGPVKAIERCIELYPDDKWCVMLQKRDWKKEIGKWFGTEFNKDGDNAFHAALFSQNFDSIMKVYQIFTERGVRPRDLLESTQSKLKHNSLMIAARMGTIFQRIYEKYTAVCGDPTFIDQQGYTILHILAQTKDVDNLAFCMSRLTHEQKGKMLKTRAFRTLYTPIAIAVVRERIDIVRCFLDGGVSEQIRIRDGDGNMPIHMAVIRGLPTLVQCFIKVDEKLLVEEDAAGNLPRRIARDRYLLDRTRTNPLCDVPYDVSTEFLRNTTNWISNRCETEAAEMFAPPPTLPETFDKQDYRDAFKVVNKPLTHDPGWERQLASREAVSEVVALAVTNAANPREDDIFNGRPDSPSLGPDWRPL